jgi:GxxExxY protein
MNHLSARAADRDPMTGEIIGAAIKVHRILGPGLLESTYEECLCHELSKRDIEFRRQILIPIQYEDVLLSAHYRIDLLVEDRVILELKTVEKLDQIHRAQLLTYMRHARKPIGLLVNFNVPLLRDGIERLILTP